MSTLIKTFEFKMSDNTKLKVDVIEEKIISTNEKYLITIIDHIKYSIKSTEIPKQILESIAYEFVYNIWNCRNNTIEKFEKNIKTMPINKFIEMMR